MQFAPEVRQRVDRDDSYEMILRFLLLVVCLESLLLLSEAVNPACECIIYDVKQRVRGVFTSPSFPVLYSANINCILYTFIGRPNHIVQLTFLHFDLPLPLTTKCSHFVRLFLDLDRPEVNEQNRWNYELCGNLSMIQTQYYSSTPSLTLEFHTDSVQGNYTGFRGNYEFLDKAQFEVVGGSRRWGNRCIYDFYSSKGVKTGAFFSPRFPQNYPPNTNCQYVFYGAKSERVSILFHVIQLEAIHGGCHNSPDYVIVRDGTDVTSPQLALYCNTFDDVTVTSTGENVIVELVADNKNQMKGFSAAFAFLARGHHTPHHSPVVPLTTTTTLSSGPEEDYHAILETLYVTSGPRQDKHGSSLDFNNLNPGDSPAQNATRPTDFEVRFLSSASRNGSFVSIGYPDPYPPSIAARYMFVGAANERVQIIFSELELNMGTNFTVYPDLCEEVDSVTVSVLIRGVSCDIGVFCGNRRPPMLMSTGPQLDVTLISRSLSVNTRGFSANYNFVTDFGIKSGEQDPSKLCQFTFRSTHATNGTFTSPNFPGRYPLNTQCHYLFYGEDNERIYITFPYFDVEGVQPGCLESSQSDYVEFSNFNIHLIDRKMNRMCGTKSNHFQKSVSSDGSFFRVTFNSNEAYDATGFEAFYQFRKFEELFSPSKPRPRFASVNLASRLTSLSLAIALPGISTRIGASSFRLN